MSGHWRNYDSWYPPPSRPREAKGGIRLASRRGKIAVTWWADRWIGALEAMGLGPRLGRGRSYARSGQVLGYEIRSGTVTAEVQGSRKKPYRVTIELAPFRRKEWDAAVGAMAKRAEFAARLLTGEMPETIDQAFQAAGISLFPRKARDLKVACSCPDWADVCKHVAAVYYIIGEAFNSDPFMLFALRGRGKGEILEAIRHARGLAGKAADAAPGASEARLAPSAAPAVPPESSGKPQDALDPASFWSAGPGLESFKAEPQPAALSGGTLKRLGRAPLGEESAMVERVLLRTYADASSAALKIARH
jgi:uncharacterized Zn finger protein